MVRVTGPGKGLPPSSMDDLIGKKLARHVEKEGFFLDMDIQPVQDCLTDLGNRFKSKWGLIARFSDFHKMISFNPRVIEIHMAEKDLEAQFTLDQDYPQELIVHTAEYMDGQLMDLCSSDEEVRQASVQLVNETARRTAELARHFTGTPKLIAHPGAMSLKDKLDQQLLKSQLLKSISEIDSCGTALLLENLPPYPWYFGGAWKGNYFMDAGEIAEFCQTCGVDIVFDTSHAALYCNASGKDLEQYTRTVYPYIRHIHIGDGYGLDGEGMQIQEGDIDFNRIMPLFSEYTESWVPEIWRGHLHDGKGFFEAIKRLSQYKF